MRTKLTAACALAAFVAIAGGTAEATGLIHTSNIAKGAVTLDRLSPRVQKLVTAMPKDGVNGANGIDGIPGAPGAKGATGAEGPIGPMGAAGSAGAKGEKGDTGDTGATGATGETGARGPEGPKGDTGTKGERGPAGADGTNGVDAPPAQYGIAQVMVSRGGAPASAWATYSTALGSPVGDTTGGAFRFTCSSAKAPCTVGVSAKVTGSDHAIYPRLLVYNAGDGNGQGTALTTCEYLDGPVTNVTSAGVTVGLAAGGSYDCGVASTTDRTDANFGMVTSALVVPAGYYDVHSTFTFLP